MKSNILLAFAIITLLSKPSHEASYYSPPPIQNPRLLKAYAALQAWKQAITSDPQNFTSNWCGPNVCNYSGIYCAPAQDDPSIRTVAGIDLNHANISGYLAEELGLLSDLSLLHINSNKFCGSVPYSFHNLHLLYELDLSNNDFSGQFPEVVFSLPALKFLDIRFNRFEGKIPYQLFDLKLDALFINNNNFQSILPSNFGNSPVSVLVLANNNFSGCIPSSLTKMAGTIHEIMMINMGLTGCIQSNIGLLNQVRVFDVSDNKLVGYLPESIGNMKKLEQLNVAHNKLSGEIPESICRLPKLENFTYSDNYFCREPQICLNLQAKNDTKNCFADRPLQRSPQECMAFYAHPVQCSSFGCSSPLPPPPPPPLPVHPYKYPWP